ncbi:hypothetical protein M885DRAFT_510828, partial [Pelagophyceae sp. CCMP2097]
MRNLALQINGVGIGRPGEGLTFSFDLLTWDSRLMCAFGLWPQFKTHKYKKIILMAGENRLSCVLTAFGTAFATGALAGQVYDPRGQNYVFDDLQGKQAVSTKLSGYLQAMTTSSNNVAYSTFKVDCLPEGATAAGQRVGGIGDMAAAGVTAEFIAMASGHVGESVLWSYLGNPDAMIYAAILPVNGWPAPPYAQTGGIVTPAKLEALVDLGAADMKQLDALTDDMLRLRVGFAPPELISAKGKLRAMARSMAASLIKYYADSVIAGEVVSVTTQMRSSMVAVGLAANGDEAHTKLVKYGEAIQRAFDAANLPVTSRDRLNGHEQAVHVVQQLAATVAQLQVKLATRDAETEARYVRMERAIAALGGHINAFGTALASRGASSPAKAGRSPPPSARLSNGGGPDGHADAAAALLRRTDRGVAADDDRRGGVDRGVAADDQRDDQGGSGGDGRRVAAVVTERNAALPGAPVRAPGGGGGASNSAADGRHGAVVRAPVGNFFDSSHEAPRFLAAFHTGATCEPPSMARKLAVDYFIAQLKSTVRVKNSDATRAKCVVACFNAAASTEERTMLRANDTPDLRVALTVQAVHDSVVARMLAIYAEEPDVVVPRSLLTWK